MSYSHNILRWICVVPAGIVAAAIVAFPVHWFVMVNFVEGWGIDPVPVIEIRDPKTLRSIEYMLQALFGPMAFIYFAARTAPNHKMITSVLFAGIIVLGMPILSYWVNTNTISNESGILIDHGFAQTVAHVMGAAVAIYMVRSHERIEYKVESAEQTKITFNPLFIVTVALLTILSANQNTHPLLFIFGLVLTINLVHLCGFVTAGLLVRASIEKIEIFYGSKLAVLNFGSVSLSIGSIPTGGSVTFKGMEFSKEEAKQEDFRRLLLTWRLAIIISGPLAVFLLASFCIGPAEAGRSFASGFKQVVIGAITPLSQGQVFLRKAVDLLQTQGFIIALGVLSAKMTAVNLLPIPPMNGGQLLMELFRVRIEKSNTAFRYQILGLTLVMLVFIGWCIAISKFAFVSLRGG